MKNVVFAAAPLGAAFGMSVERFEVHACPEPCACRCHAFIEVSPGELETEKPEKPKRREFYVR